MSWRKIDVKGSDKQATVLEFGAVQRVEWQPGNGSRYQIIVTRLDQSLEVPGLEDGGVLVVDGPTTYATHAGYFGFGLFLTAGYVKEKMKYRSLVDASEVTKIIGTMLNCPIRVYTRPEDGELFHPEEFVDIE